MGWLDAFTEGDLVAVTIDDGFVDVGLVAHPPSVPDHLEGALGQAFDAFNEGDGFPWPIDELVLAALVSDRQAFGAPLPPLDELLPTMGLECRENEAARIGCDWSTYDDMRDAVRLLATYGLEADELKQLRAALAACAGSTNRSRRSAA